MITETIKKFLGKYTNIIEEDDTKFFLLKKDKDGNLFLPLELLGKKNGKIPIVFYYQYYPFNKDYVLAKFKIRYLRYDIIYNNDKYFPSGLLKFPKVGKRIKDEYYFIYNFLQVIESGSNEKITYDTNKIITETETEKMMRYEYIKKFIINYQERLQKIFKDNVSYKDITNIMINIREQKTIKKIEKFPFLEKKLTNKSTETSYLRLTEEEKDLKEKILKVFEKLEISPLMNGYLTIENDDGKFYDKDHDKEIHHLFYSFNDIKDHKKTITDSRKYIGYIIKEGYIVLNLGIYLSALEEQYVLLFLKNREEIKINDLKTLLTAKDEEILSVQMSDMLYDNGLYNLINLIELVKSDVLLGAQEYIISLQTEKFSTGVPQNYRNVGSEFNKSFRPFLFKEDNMLIKNKVPQKFLEQAKNNIHPTEDFLFFS